VTQAVTKLQTRQMRARNAAQGAARGESGFTLIETSIALVLLLVAALSIASLFTYAIKYNTGANDRAMAQAIAQQQMESLRKMSFNDIAAESTTVYMAGRPFAVVTTVCNDGTVACGGSTSAKRISVRVTPQTAGPVWAQSSVLLISLRSASSSGPYLQ